MNGSAGAQPGPKSRSSAPTKQTSTRSGERPASSARRSALARVSATTRSAAAQRMPVEARERARRRATRTEAPAVGDERVRERDERVEDDRPPARGAASRRKVEVPRVADDRRRRSRLRGRRSSRTSASGEPRGRTGAGAPVLTPPSQTPRAAPHLDPGAAQARDHLRVSRVVTLVGAEVEDAHAIAATCAGARLLPRERTEHGRTRVVDVEARGLRRLAAPPALATRPAPRAGS